MCAQTRCCSNQLIVMRWCMHLPSRAATVALYIAAIVGPCSAQEWTETSIIQKFLDQNPMAREARARVAIAQAEARGRILYANPSFNYTREGAGLTEFFQAEQAIPINGRLKLLRQAGDSALRATEAEGAFDIWQARASLRLAFYEVLAAQERQAVYATGLKEIEDVIRVLRDREREGEGSKFDRLRTERERAELLAELGLVQAETELVRSRMLAFLPADIQIASVSGAIETPLGALPAAEMVRRALGAREDYRAEQRRLEQFRLEERAADRLKIPEPVLNAGFKRADIGQNRIANGGVVSITIPLPLFNKGQAEVARYSAEQERISARLQILTQRIRAAVEGTVRALNVRVQARDRYRQELADSGPELIKIATVAYQEGEIGILQLLDAYRSQRQAQLRMLDIQAAVKEAQIELERVVGEELGK
ncbi:MAG: TolC family protein [Bryobacterales bacterium]|nr:TolC family protein [Bryobacterales bacterium]